MLNSGYTSYSKFRNFFIIRIKKFSKQSKSDYKWIWSKKKLFWRIKNAFPDGRKILKEFHIIYRNFWSKFNKFSSKKNLEFKFWANSCNWWTRMH